jgi:phage terminase small subunit
MAMTSMPNGGKLTAKQTRFVAEYLIDLNAAGAARRAGYSPAMADQASRTLLQKPTIRTAISARQAEQLAKADLAAVRVLEEYGRVAFADVRMFFGHDGNLKGISELTAEQGSALASFEVIVKSALVNDGKAVEIHKIRLWDKLRALEALAKHFGLLVDKVEHGGDVTYKWQDGPA